MDFSSELNPIVKSQERLTRRRKLSTAAPSHPLVTDIAEKSKAFDEAASKFSIAA